MPLFILREEKLIRILNNREPKNSHFQTQKQTDMKNFKKGAIETIVAIAVLLPIFFIGYLFGLELNQIGW